MRRVFRFRLYPTGEQEDRMLSMIETCRRLWNDALWHREDRWKRREKTSYLMQQAILTQERKRDERLKGMYSQVEQGMPEVTPVEIGPTPERASPVIEAGTRSPSL